MPDDPIGDAAATRGRCRETHDRYLIAAEAHQLERERFALNSLMYGVAALCRSVGVTDPDDMDQIMIGVLSCRLPRTPSEALAHVETSARELCLNYARPRESEESRSNQCASDQG